MEYIRNASQRRFAFLVSLATALAVIVGCDGSDIRSERLSSETEVRGYYNSAGPLKTLRSVGFNTIFFDIYINDVQYTEGLSEGERFSIGVADVVDLPLPTASLTLDSNRLRVEFCYLDDSGCRLIATLEQNILVADGNSVIELSPRNFDYPDRDANNRRDIYDVTIEPFIQSVQNQTYTRTRLDTQGYTNGFGPDPDIVSTSSQSETLLAELNQVYGYGISREGQPQFQIVQPMTLDASERWGFGRVPGGGDTIDTGGTEEIKAPHYLHYLDSSYGICNGNLEQNSISAIRAKTEGGLQEGVLLLVFRKEGAEFLVPMTGGDVADLGRYVVGNIFDNEFVDETLTLGDGLVAVVAPIGTVGWFTAWRDAGFSDDSPQCSFNLTSPPLIR